PDEDLVGPGLGQLELGDLERLRLGACHRGGDLHAIRPPDSGVARSVGERGADLLVFTGRSGGKFSYGASEAGGRQPAHHWPHRGRRSRRGDEPCTCRRPTKPSCASSSWRRPTQSWPRPPPGSSPRTPSSTSRAAARWLATITAQRPSPTPTSAASGT